MATFTTTSGRNGNQIVAGVGWKAVFRGGRCRTSDEVTANGLRRYSVRHPEYGISEVDEEPAAEPEAIEQGAEPWEPTGEQRKPRRRRAKADPARDDEPGIDEVPDPIEDNDDPDKEPAGWEPPDESNTDPDEVVIK